MNKKDVQALLFCNSCFVIWYFIFIMQFYLILYACNHHSKFIHTRVDIALAIKFASSWWWSFWTKVKTYVALLTLLSQMNLTFYDIPYSNITYIQVFVYIVIKINIDFDHWTQYSTESAMCHCLITLTNLFLLLNKVVNQVSFHLEWLVYLISVQETEQTRTYFTSLIIVIRSKNFAQIPSKTFWFCSSQIMFFIFFLKKQSMFFL